MAQRIGSERERVAVGALGGSTPVLLNLAIIDASTVLGDLTLLAVFSYLLRVAALIALGALVAWLHEDEKNRLRVFQLGVAAPAILTGLVNGVALRSDAANRGAGLNLATPVHAAQQVETFEPARETATQQVLRGLLGVRPALAEWVVEVHGAGREQQALQEAQTLRKNYPGLSFIVFQPSAGVDEWVVTIGGQMTQAAAKRELENAEKLKIPGVALRLISGRQ